MLKTVICSRIVLLVSMILPFAASSAGDRVIETVSISADEAFEDIQPGILHFNGHFLMRSGDWRLESERAIVYGQPDRPDRVFLNGSPALFLISRHPGEDQETVEASAPMVEYQRSGNLLRLSGGAVLKMDGEIISSGMIEYDIETDRYRAEGTDGVMIEVIRQATD